MTLPYVLHAFRRLLLRCRLAKARWRRHRALARHTRKLATILRDEPAYVADALDMFFCQNIPIAAIAVRLAVPVEDVRDAFLRIIEHFDEDVR
ncbi:hypothetical protein QUC32_02675 [Novosphingobium resinovorum]|uniref:hypothetical protein n=1 Tax=Novosphingobium TaxID=165696 RepID=UPI001B3C812D|nr:MULTISPECIES: hypothetical protein [Novosphingobium]MBF7013741.1 hypothetical protein [Novosphingobium sp. HR1a]WJM25885.1 hypothetical protein QUC32_02675 [Novosphingobium resinovorum]